MCRCSQTQTQRKAHFIQTPCTARPKRLMCSKQTHAVSRSIQLLRSIIGAVVPPCDVVHEFIRTHITCVLSKSHVIYHRVHQFLRICMARTPEIFLSTSKSQRSARSLSQHHISNSVGQRVSSEFRFPGRGKERGRARRRTSHSEIFPFFHLEITKSIVMNPVGTLMVS